MRREHISQAVRAGLLVFRISLVNTILVTVLSALVIALLNGTGSDVPFTARAGFASQEGGATLPIPIGHLWEVGRATVLLCPITIVSCGWFGFVAGAAGAILLFFRRRSIRSTKRLVVESAAAGLMLGAIFPLADGRATVPHAVLCMLCGSVCGSICAGVFRKRFSALTVKNRVACELGGPA